MALRCWFERPPGRRRLRHRRFRTRAYRAHRSSVSAYAGDVCAIANAVCELEGHYRVEVAFACRRLASVTGALRDLRLQDQGSSCCVPFGGPNDEPGRVACKGRGEKHAVDLSPLAPFLVEISARPSLVKFGFVVVSFRSVCVSSGESASESGVVQVAAPAAGPVFV
jgi:hypothetical protein